MIFHNIRSTVPKSLYMERQTQTHRETHKRIFATLCYERTKYSVFVGVDGSVVIIFNILVSSAESIANQDRTVNL
jgi:hypothetical protein